MKIQNETELELIKDAERKLHESLDKLKNAIEISQNIQLNQKLGTIYFAIKKQKSKLSNITN